ncbi:hypothetical protein IAT38_006422 [Cryptococcus sp. DSM 104549]
MAEAPESGPSRLQGGSSQPSTSPSRPAAEGEVPGEQAPGTVERAKRKADGPVKPKNLQACDRCRVKKIKCQPSDNHRDVCRACSSVPLTCTFDMPLTASRTKRIRRGMSQAANVGPGGAEEGGGTRMTRSESRDDEEEERNERHRSGEIRRRSFSRIGATPSAVEIFREARSMRLTTPARTTSVRREGPTAMSYILHSTPTLPISYLSDYDTHHCLSMYSTPPDSGDGFILVATEPLAPPSSDPPPHVVEALHSPSWNEVVNRLVETYLVHVSPLIPIVLREEMSEASLLMTHAMAAVAAARKNCPKEIFDCLQYILKQEMYEQDTLSDPTRQNVQILLISCLIDNLALESGAAAPASVQRARLSAAIRMAQDLSMDNPIPDTLIGEADARIWQCAITIDQWNAARTGARPIIPNALLSPSTPSSSRPRDPDMEFFQQLFSLSLILSRILGKVYGPEGVKRTTNADLHGIRDDLLKWKEELSGKLKFSGVWSSLPAGILHLLHTTLTILLYRPFMRWSFICPAHLDLSLDLPVWITLNSATRHALEWAANQDDLADLLFIGPYALVLACLIQYHSYARRREWDGVVMLEKFQRDAVDRWTSRASGGHLVLQSSQLEIISLFYAATQNTLRTGTTSYDSPTSPRGLNPTPGVLNRLPETSIHGVTFLRDPTHPQGGVLVATQQAAREIKDLPVGTVIIGGPEAVRVTGAGGGGEAGGGGVGPGQHGPAPYDALANPNGAFNVGGALLDGLGAEGRMSVSTPDWEAIVSSFTFGGADAGAVGGGAIGGGAIGGV